MTTASASVQVKTTWSDYTFKSPSGRWGCAGVRVLVDGRIFDTVGELTKAEASDIAARFIERSAAVSPATIIEALGKSKRWREDTGTYTFIPAGSDNAVFQAPQF